MARLFYTAALAATAFTGAVLADTGATCGGGTLCPQDTPCCGQYGVCGVGAFCLGGCDITHSHSIDACVPNPFCKSTTYDLKSLDDVQDISDYLGDASKINWQAQGKPVVYQDSLLLTMAEGTVGTLLASTHYVWYGKICAKMTTSQGQGVVTAFILMSDVKDEIDFEFVGVDIENTQSNFYSQGVTVYTNEKNLTVGNTVEKVHEYCVDWTEDTLTWSVDGNDERTLNRKDTWNATAGRWDYPQTPARIMLSLWPAGLPTNAKGTVEWAGGEIDWNSQYMQNGYYYAMVQQVTVECYDPPSGTKSSGNQNSYLYTDKSATNNTVQITDKVVILGSLYASGEDPEDGATTVSNAPHPTKSVNVVPGGNPGGGNMGEGVSTAASNPSATGGSGGGGDSPAATSAGSGTGGSNFVQGGGQGAGTSLQPGLGKVGGGAFAIVVAILGLIVL